MRKNKTLVSKRNTTRIKIYEKPEKISYDVGRNACKGMKCKTSKKIKYVDVYTYAIFSFFYCFGIFFLYQKNVEIFRSSQNK